MKVLSWNIRGLNSKGKQRYLKEKLQVEKPQVMMLQETKVTGQKLETILKSFKMQYEVMAIDARGTSGGIAILWNGAEIVADRWIGLPRILTATFRQIGAEERILISTVYGPPIPGERATFLQNIRNLSTMHREKYWLIGGDFNIILNLLEKKGGIRREEPEMTLFREVIQDLHLVDIPTVNGKFTWNNRRGERHQVAARLDRFLASEALVSRDIYYEAAILPALGSDHWPITFEIDIKASSKNRSFRFELFWLRDPRFIEKVKNWWNANPARGNNKMHSFQLRLK